ncbi:MAG: hypothetical protein WCO81_02715 [Cyanobacteriota bacterium ELA615]
MSTIAINDLNVVSALSDLEVKSVVGGYKNNNAFVIGIAITSSIIKESTLNGIVLVFA